MASDYPSSSPPASPPSRKRQWWLFGLLLIVAIALGWLNLDAWVEKRDLPKGKSLEAPAALSFDGSSARLRETVFVPTLEQPIPDGKSALWCATMSMAWQEMERTIGVQPLEVEGSEAICRQLSKTPKANLEPEHYYVAGGWAKDGIVERIRREVAPRFPGAQLPEPLRDDQAIAYACLDAALEYEFFFKHSAEPLRFMDSGGRETAVHAFGIRERDKGDQHQDFREQVLALFREKGRYAVDLSRNSKPYQIILARMDRKPTLWAALEYLNARIAANEPKHLNSAAVLLVPSMNWRAEHRFRELEKPLTNGLGSIDDVYQSIQFKLDRQGARVGSRTEVRFTWNGHPDDPNPDHYLFDRPYLIVMKKRGSVQPFFVMWVDNAELLQGH